MPSKQRILLNMDLIRKELKQIFIRYVQDDTFDSELLSYGHEIEIINLLSKRSKTFLSAENNNE